VMSEESMTPDLVELARRSFEPAASQDIDGVISFYHADAVWDLSAVGLEAFRGRAAITQFMEDWFRSYDRLEFDVEGAVDLGNGVVFVVALQKGRLADTSDDVTFRYAAVAVWEDGLIVSVTNYTDVDDARAASERLADERG
jgi:ketosteroid isomerase-like protein